MKKVLIQTGHKQESFLKGAVAAGYRASLYDIGNPLAQDFLVVWNVKQANRSMVKRFEKSSVIVAENGYIGSDDNGNRLIAMALDGHAGQGRWYVGKESRHHRHNFKIHPWRRGGRKVVIMGQRGIGNAAPEGWAYGIEKTIKTKREIVVRPHPGKMATPLEPALDDAHCVITWSSGAAIKALAYGVPVFYCMERWIGAPAAVYGISDIESPYLGCREAMFHRLGWAQWTQEEVASGLPYKYLEML